jgi:superfamily II DNA or RNA helicase
MKGYAASAAVWMLASRWVLEALMSHKLVPALMPGLAPGTWVSRWRVAPVRTEDRARLNGLAGALPGVARAWVSDTNGKVRRAASVLHAFLDAAADGLMRSATVDTAPRPGPGPGWAVRLGEALAGPTPDFALQGLGERQLPSALEHWIASATSFAAGGRPVIGFRLEEPSAGDGPWRVTYHLIGSAGESRLSVAELKRGEGEGGQRMVAPEESLLNALSRCAMVFAPIARSLSERLPIGVGVDAHEAWTFLTRASVRLERAGYHVEVPAALTRVGRRRVRPRLRLGDDQDEPLRSGLLAGLVQYRWEASLGDDTLTPHEFLELAASKAPLVRHRGEWVAVDPAEIARLKALIEKGGGSMSAAEALRLALAGEAPVPDAPDAMADVVGHGNVAAALRALQEGASEGFSVAEPPLSLEGVLRPYQKRGFAWLKHVTDVGFGACLADDMGLGKTVQVLALMLHAAESEGDIRALVVCPTSVVGNWRREIERFTPALRCAIHHGPQRAQTMDQFSRRMGRELKTRGTIVVTSYALVRGDQDLLTKFTFDVVVLDEAQNIKNPAAVQSQAVRKLNAIRRIALTGTPVENRVSELWSIIDFLNPGLMGSLGHFRRQFSVPIERDGDREAADQLRKLTAPFILRRLKADPTIAPELPEKGETVRFCPLTREQAALYQAALEQGMQDISGLEQGMARRGRILAMLTALKQICNHPAHYLRDRRITPSRSGKFVRFLEIIEHVFDSGGSALVFTQYREMGDILVEVITQLYGFQPPFLHGSLSRNARERVVADFQSPLGPRLMVVSLRAGGTGLNLTRANHVFHYDRWWNPAVEDQATDRAFRIGQTRDVTVHRMVSQGTLEEQVHQILEDKRLLADRVIGTDETWLGDLDDSMLYRLVSLGSDALLDEDGEA